MKRLKVAVVGCGAISPTHLDAYAANPSVELFALCDINAARLSAAGAKYGVTRLYDDYNTMFAELPELDAVSICTWNNFHAPIAIAALEAGNHVLCEKPMALNAAEAIRMQKTAERVGKKLMLGFVRRFGQDCVIAKDLIGHGMLGDVYYAQAKYLRRNGNPGGWFADKAYSGGGPLIDLGVHVIDLARYLMGGPKPVSVSAMTADLLKASRAASKDSAKYIAASAGDRDFRNDVEDFAVALIRFDSGAVLNVEASYALETGADEGMVALYGTKGGLRIDPRLHFYSQMLDYPVNVSFETPCEFSGQAYADEVDSFVRCIRGEGDCIAPAEDGVTLMKILDAVYRSAQEGREVVID